MEWRGLPSPGSTTASSRLLHVFERYWPQAARSPEELRTFLNNELKLCQINHLFLDRILLQLVTRICHQHALSLLQQENRGRRAGARQLWTRSWAHTKLCAPRL